MKKDLKEAILGIEVIQFDGQRADLEELVNPKQLEKIISDWIPEVLSQEWIDSNSINASHDGVTEEYVHVDDLENLIIPKRELPVIPKYVAEYLDFAKKGSSLIQVMETASVIDGWPTMKKVFDWISANDETFARAWVDGYEVEEPLYRALIKGHELIDGAKIYWYFNISNDGVFVSKLSSIHDNFIFKMSKSEWNKLGIIESNADFVEVAE